MWVVIVGWLVWGPVVMSQGKQRSSKLRFPMNDQLQLKRQVCRSNRHTRHQGVRVLCIRECASFAAVLASCMQTSAWVYTK